MAPSLSVPAALAVHSKVKPADDSPTIELTEGLAAGEEEAFRKFYDQYSRRLFAFLFVICGGNGDQASELLQQTMIKVARYARVFEEEEIFWKWLTMLARSSWTDESRKSMRYLAALQRFWNGKEEARSPYLPDDGAVQIAMVRSLELLPEDDRLLLLQKYVEGRSVREIAMSAGISEKAIESRLTRARSRMKEIVATLSSK